LLPPPGFVAPRIVAVPHPRLSENPSAEGGYRWKHGCALPPCGPCHRGTVIAANAAAAERSCHRAGRYRAEDGRGKRGGYGTTGGKLQRVLCTRDGTRPVRGARQAKVSSGRASAQKIDAVPGEAMKAAWATGNAHCTCCALRRCCASYSRCRTRAGFERRTMRRWTRSRRAGR
jgi:hypothetical protein